ncbi:MAG: GNAT family N-acetyltransferase [Bacteroidota bacterium]
MARYHQDWGKEGDYGIVVQHGEENIGAIWVRFFTKENPGYGFVEEGAPEMGIALKKEFRGQGLGRKLIQELFVALKSKGITALSLSTDSRNPAMQLYTSCGFEEVDREEYSVRMYKKLE